MVFWKKSGQKNINCNKNGEHMKEIIILFIILAIWFVLQAYILPKLGVSTWMSDACQLTGNKKDPKKADTELEGKWVIKKKPAGKI